MKVIFDMFVYLINWGLKVKSCQNSELFICYFFSQPNNTEWLAKRKMSNIFHFIGVFHILMVGLKLIKTFWYFWSIRKFCVVAWNWIHKWTVQSQTFHSTFFIFSNLGKATLNKYEIFTAQGIETKTIIANFVNAFQFVKTKRRQPIFCGQALEQVCRRGLWGL